MSQILNFVLSVVKNYLIFFVLNVEKNITRIMSIAGNVVVS